MSASNFLCPSSSALFVHEPPGPKNVSVFLENCYSVDLGTLRVGGASYQRFNPCVTGIQECLNENENTG